MESLNPEVVQQLRAMTRQGVSVPQMLRAILKHVGPEQPPKVILIKYLREAFGLTLRQASPVGGWMPDASGELSDAQLNDLLLPEIMKNRPMWDASETAAAPG